MMNILTEVREWQSIRKQIIHQTIGLVHTMGNLHEGHVSLFQRARNENDIVVASIFVNPMQFNQISDFERYPKTLEQDQALLIDQKIDYLLIFPVSALYPDRYEIKVSETEITKILEGEFRPEHFTGMLTIVLKFLNLVQPARSYYGEKDYQQLLLIKKMANALFLPTEIIACETIRASDSVAHSSRNSRLTHKQREIAKHFPRLLNSALTCEEVKTELMSYGFKIDYIVEKWQHRLGAVWLDDVRLIDNFKRV